MINCYGASRLQVELRSTGKQKLVLSTNDGFRLSSNFQVLFWGESLLPNVSSPRSKPCKQQNDNVPFFFSELDSDIPSGFEEKSVLCGIVIPFSQRVVTQLATGVSHVLFLLSCGEVVSYGTGFIGQLGLGTNCLICSTPEKVGFPDETKIKEIAAGEAHSLALTTEGRVLAWGDGALLAGIGVHSYVPVPVFFDQESFDFDSDPLIDVIAAGFRLSAAVDTKNNVFVWGMNHWSGYIENPKICKVPVSETDNKISVIGIGQAFILFLTKLGKVFGWGDSTFSELPRKKIYSGLSRFFLAETVAHVDSKGNALPPIQYLCCGARHALLLSYDGRVWAFGDNRYGQCGVVDHLETVSVPTIVELRNSPSTFTRISAGTVHSAFISQRNILYTCGSSSCHKLIFTAPLETLNPREIHAGVGVRSGSKDSYCEPTPVYELLNREISNISLGPKFTIVITASEGPLDSSKENIET